MANYVIADIHGEYDAFEELLAKISFGDEDTLYITGGCFGQRTISHQSDAEADDNAKCDLYCRKP